jgi:hypothetical protein
VHATYADLPDVTLFRRTRRGLSRRHIPFTRAQQPVAAAVAHEELLVPQVAAQRGRVVAEWLEPRVDFALVVATPPREGMSQLRV